MRSLTACFFLLLGAALTGHSQSVSASLSSANLIQGESAKFTLTFTGATPPSAPKVKASPGLIVDFANSGRPRSFGGALVKSFVYHISSGTIGSHTIESLSFSMPQGDSLKTQEFTLTVRPPTTPEIVWQEARVGNQSFPFGVAVFIDTLSPYVGQSLPVELKVYIPRGLQFNANQLPEFELEGMNAHRFNPEDQLSEVMLRGQRHIAVTYRSIVSALQAGDVRLGPGTLEIPCAIRFPGRSFVLSCELPQLNFSAKALPAGAPTSFKGAVGEFSLSGSVDLDSAEPGGPFSVQLAVAGHGNLDIVQTPKLVDETGWKLYPPTRTESESVRHEGRGTITFDQLLRPTREAESIPAFEFSYFDPATEEYETLSSGEIELPEDLRALPVTGSASPTGAILPPARVDQPLEEMLDTLGLVDPFRTSSRAVWPPKSHSVSAWWNLIPAILIGLLLYPIIRRVSQKKLSERSLTERQKQVLADLDNTAGDRAHFYRAAGKFIESTPALANSPEVQDLLVTRDDLCFDTSSVSSEKIDRDERTQIISKIRSILLNAKLLVILTFALSLFSSHAAPFEEVEESFHKGDYTYVIETYEAGPQTADALYNIGTAQSRLGQPGIAALYFRRALALDPTHPEAQQNLRFIERSQGSLTAPDPGWASFLTARSQSFYRLAAQFAIWTLVGGIILFVFYPRRRSLAFGLSIIAVILLVVFSLFVENYPAYGDFRSKPGLAVVTQKDVKALSEPLSSAKSVIKAPPGSLCTILAVRGNWTYASFPQGTRGWLRSDDLSAIVPQS